MRNEEREETIDRGESKSCPWTTWDGYKERGMIRNVNGRDYAEIGGYLFSDHAVARMGFGPWRYGEGDKDGVFTEGRSIPPRYAIDAIEHGSQEDITGPRGEPRRRYTLGDIQVVVERDEPIVVSVQPTPSGRRGARGPP